MRPLRNASRKRRSKSIPICPDSGIAGQCDSPPVPRRATRSGQRSTVRRIADPESVAAVQRRRHAGKTIDDDGYHWQLGSKQMQREHHAVIKCHFLRGREVDIFGDAFGERAGEPRVSSNTPARDIDELFVRWSRKLVADTDAKRMKACYREKNLPSARARRPPARPVARLRGACVDRHRHERLAPTPATGGSDGRPVMPGAWLAAKAPTRLTADFP